MQGKNFVAKKCSTSSKGLQVLALQLLWHFYPRHKLLMRARAFANFYDTLVSTSLDVQLRFIRREQKKIVNGNVA